MSANDTIYALFTPPDAETPPVPTEHAEPVERLIQSLLPGHVAFLLRPAATIPAGWLTTERIDCHLREAMLEPLPVSVWPLLPDAWAISLALDGEPDDPNALLQVHMLCDALRRRLEQDWSAVGAPFPALPEGDASEQGAAEVPAPRFLVTPVAPLRPVSNMQENIAELNSLLDIIVNQRLHTQFQPIVHLGDGHIVGYEALIRGPKGTLLRRAGGMFHAAEKARMVSWFDLACLEQCFRQVSLQGLRHLLFVNMEAEGLASLDMHDRSLAMRAREYGLTPAQIVIEVTERQTIGDFPRLLADIGRLREEGFKIAVDDAGAGYNSLHAIAALRPEFVKIDRNLVRNLDVSGERRALLAALVRYARQIGTAVLGEGAETREELGALIDLGVTYGQGYLMGKPSDHLRGISRENCAWIQARSRQRSLLTQGRSVRVEGLMQKGMAVEPETPLPAVLRAFYRDPSLTGVVVVEEGYVRGLLMRYSLDHVLEMATAANVAQLLPGETVSQWMQTGVLCVTPDTSLIGAVRMATTRTDFNLEADLVVVNGENRYLGVLPMRQALEALATQQTYGQRYADSLSGLPNRVVLEQALQERIAARQPVGLVRADVNGLGAYNRCRGTAHGDEVILALAKLLQDVLEPEEGAQDLLTHPGGGDFILVTRPERVRPACVALQAGFEGLLPQFYTAEQLRLGYVETGQERNGNARQIPLISLTTAGLTGQRRWLHQGQALQELHGLLRATKHQGLRVAIDTLPREGHRAA